MKALTVTASFVVFASSALAQEMPVPKMFKGMEKQKGQYQVEMLEGGPRGAGRMQMTVCTDNLMKPPAQKGAPKAESGCKHRLLKDTADEAVVESACPERTSTVTLKREGAKSVLMEVASTGKSGQQNMKMRYTHLGPCREGQGAVGVGKDSEQCRMMQQQAAMMDPAKQCAGAGAQREMCEKQIRDAMAQMSSMCN